MSHLSTPRFVYLLLCTLMIVAATFITLRIAITSAFDVHPDEFNHADAFCYYESKWWPPPLNADGLRYSDSGMSRLYGAEIVYFLFGKTSALLRPIVEPWLEPQHLPLVKRPSHLFLPAIKSPDYCFIAFRTYRLLNVILLIVTLAVLFWAGKHDRWMRSLALLILATPMAIYIYSYGNSDAWGLSMSAFLLIYALTLHRQVRMRRRDALWLGLLTAMVLLSKSTFWLSIPFAYMILAHKCFEMWQREREALASSLRPLVLMVLAIVFLLILPMKIVYPLSQGNYEAKVLEMYELRARTGFRPSSPQGGYLLKQRGFPISIVTADLSWWRHSYQSFYGYFGYWTRRATDVAYVCAAILALLGVGCTYFDFIRRRSAHSGLAHLMLFVTPLFIVAIIPASIYNSWAVDLQPQGRYLLYALLPLSFLVGGAADDEPRWLGSLRWLIWILLLALSFYTLWILAIAAPTMHN